MVRAHVRFPDKISIRDEEAIISIASGLLKILYPHLDVSNNAFGNYCLQPAVQMRQIVRISCGNWMTNTGKQTKT